MTPSNPPSGGYCTGQPVQWWYPDLLTRNPADVRAKMRANAEKAMTLCRLCPVLEPCREYALEWELYGIWGGMTEKERRNYRLKHNIPYRRQPPSEALMVKKNA